jgi:hypothetical protein
MKKGPGYRFAVILIVYLFVGAVVLISLAGASRLGPVALWIFLGVWVLSFLLTVILNEFFWRKEKK